MSERAGFISEEVQEKREVEQTGFTAPLGGWRGNKNPPDGGETRPKNPNLFEHGEKPDVPANDFPKDPHAN